jgi:hypothetical protein
MTHCGLDSLGIDARLGAIFSKTIQPGPGAQPASYTTGTVSFLGVKQSKSGTNHSPPSSNEVKEKKELYLNSSSMPSWQVIG